MPAFSYEAVDAAGSTKKGVVNADSARDILQKVIRANSRLSSKQNGALH